MNKDRQIVSELHNFFTENGCGLGIQRIINVLGTINITERQMAFEKKPNCKFTCAQVIQMMILFPFFSIKNVANYIGSSLYPLFDCHKGMFYRVLSNHIEEAGYDSFQVVRETVYENYPDILNFFENRSTNASAESFNSKIKNFRAQLRGVSDVKYFLFRLQNIYA